MQIEIYNPVHGEALPPVRWNYDDVKKWIDDGLSNYKGIVYTPDTIVQAKKDRASLNKLVDAIDAKRKEMKAHYLQPYEAFEAQAKELVAMVKSVNAEIDAQVKAYEAFKKEEKLQQIKALYQDMVGDLANLVPYERLHNPKWLNVTFSIPAVTEELGNKIDRIMAGLKSIDTLGLDDDLTSRIKSVFLQSFDLAAALAEKDRILREREELARLKAAQTAAQAEPRVIDASDPDAFKKARPGDVVRFGGPGCVSADHEVEQQGTPAPDQVSNDTTDRIIDITFRIRVPEYKLKLLGEFMRANGIRPERVL